MTNWKGLALRYPLYGIGSGLGGSLWASLPGSPAGSSGDRFEGSLIGSIRGSMGDRLRGRIGSSPRISLWDSLGSKLRGSIGFKLFSLIRTVTRTRIQLLIYFIAGRPMAKFELILTQSSGRSKFLSQPADRIGHCHPIQSSYL